MKFGFECTNGLRGEELCKWLTDDGQTPGDALSSSCEPEDSSELQDQHCKPELKNPVLEQRAAPVKDDPQASAKS